MGDQTRRCGNQATENKPNGRFIPPGSSQTVQIDMDAHLPIPISSPKATANQIRIDACDDCGRQWSMVMRHGAGIDEKRGRAKNHRTCFRAGETPALPMITSISSSANDDS
jgi:hypothetical protein